MEGAYIAAVRTELADKGAAARTDSDFGFDIAADIDNSVVDMSGWDNPADTVRWADFEDFAGFARSVVREVRGYCNRYSLVFLRVGMFFFKSTLILS